MTAMSDKSERPTIKAAQIGVGRWGRNIARTIRDEIPGIRLIRAVTSREDIGDLIGDECTRVADWRDLLNDDEVEAVFLAVPPSRHREMTSAFVESGIAVFVEKPLCLSSQDGRLLLETVGRYDGIVHVDHIDLHNPAVAAIKERSSTSGPLRRIVGHIGAAYERRPDISPLWESSPHFIAVCLTAGGGDLQRVSAKRLPSEPPFSDDENRDLVQLDMAFSDGMTATVVAGNGMARKCRSLRFEFDEKSFIFDDQAESRLMEQDRSEDKAHAVPISEVRPLTASIQAFETKIRRGQPTPDDVRTGIKVIEILEAASRAIGEPLPLEPPPSRTITNSEH